MLWRRNVATSPAERQSILSDLNTLGIRDLVAVWRKAAVADTDFAALILAAFPEIANGYAAMAGDLAADWYTQSAPDLPYTATTAPLPDVTVLTKSAQWALGADGEEALNRMAGTMQRAVFDGARDTTLVNVAHEPRAAWARHASANACEFCRLMATRGAVYKSAETAAGEKYHDNCHCVAIEVRPGEEYQPPAYVQDWEDQYLQARKDARKDGPVTTKSIMAAWRQL